MECEHPASYTARAVKKVLPERAMLTKDARQTLNSAATMFTLYLSSVAHDHSVSNKRQTVVLKDVLQALRDMDFEHFIGPIEDCLRDAKVTTALKKSKRGAEKPDAVAAGANGETALAADNDDDEMQSAEDIATEEDDDDAVADEDDDEEDVAESEAADS
uniref:Transcription factor CBF/NF-Y/archaeal histone domain-containing protein n=1 Tax=Globisporangium ultimum (strain ATCC 200006 / CBS 805.95 / DAOM BR144) TaxID=431595 RepID=K3X2D9_GLOUD